MTGRGMVLATCSGGRRRPRLSGVTVRALAHWVCLWSLASLSITGCVVLPEVVEPEPAGAPLLWIDTKDVDPPVLNDFKIIGDELLSEFRVRTVQTSAGVRQPLRYYWYFDLELTGNVLPVDIYTACGSDAVCPINHCARINDEDRHTLLLVVSDQPRNEGALDPLDFPEGTAYDWVQWGIRSAATCPQ